MRKPRPWIRRTWDLSWREPYQTATSNTQPRRQRMGVYHRGLLIVLGVQIFALGMIGGIDIFAHAREIGEYTTEEIVN